jgi:hypothetical protein
VRGQRFRIRTPTVAIEQHSRLSKIPANATVTVLGEPSDGTSVIDVEWEGRVVRMFTRDLRERCEPIPD